MKPSWDQLQINGLRDVKRDERPSTMALYRIPATHRPTSPRRAPERPAQMELTLELPKPREPAEAQSEDDQETERGFALVDFYI